MLGCQSEVEVCCDRFNEELTGGRLGEHDQVEVGVVVEARRGEASDDVSASAAPVDGVFGLAGLGQRFERLDVLRLTESLEQRGFRGGFGEVAVVQVFGVSALFFAVCVVSVLEEFPEHLGQAEGVGGSHVFGQPIDSGIYPLSLGQSHPAWILVPDDLVDARAQKAFVSVLDEFAGYPASSHLLCDGRGGARPGEYVQDDVSRVGRDLDHSLQHPFGLGGGEWLLAREELLDLRLGIAVVADVFVVPQRARIRALLRDVRLTPETSC